MAEFVVVVGDECVEGDEERVGLLGGLLGPEAVGVVGAVDFAVCPGVARDE